MLDVLKDEEWHTLDEILEKGNLDLTEENLIKVLDFLHRFGLALFDKLSNQAKIGSPDVAEIVKRLER